MAYPTNFDESNCNLGRPLDMTEEECGPLSVFKGVMAGETTVIPIVVSCFKLTQEELDEIIKTKRVWVTICGQTMPPIKVEGVNLFRE